MLDHGAGRDRGVCARRGWRARSPARSGSRGITRSARGPRWLPKPACSATFPVARRGRATRLGRTRRPFDRRPPSSSCSKLLRPDRAAPRARRGQGPREMTRRTIARATTLEGIGLHLGVPVRLTFPAGGERSGCRISPYRSAGLPGHRGDGTKRGPHRSVGRSLARIRCRSTPWSTSWRP